VNHSIFNPLDLKEKKKLLSMKLEGLLEAKVKVIFIKTKSNKMNSKSSKRKISMNRIMTRRSIKMKQK
jgi:hypothetical protein